MIGLQRRTGRCDRLMGMDDGTVGASPNEDLVAVLYCWPDGRRVLSEGLICLPSSDVVYSTSSDL